MGKKSKKRKILSESSATVVANNRDRNETGNSTKEKNNPLLREQVTFLNSIPRPILENFFSNDSRQRPWTVETRADIWTRQCDLGEDLVNKYSWAIPDSRALRILKEYGPIVEIGCGANAYWAKMMHSIGINILAFDAHVMDGGLIAPNVNDNNKKKKQDRHKQQEKKGGVNFAIRRGGPDVLSSTLIVNSKRTLFLCYPDEEDDTPSLCNDGGDSNRSDINGGIPESMAAACLDHYSGQFIVHVGELYGDTLSMDHAPWGRSSSCEFQQRLAAEFHCILKAELTNWVHVRDAISVWKRTERCTMVFASEENDDVDEEVEYKHVPVEERLPMDIAAPCVAHLLEK